MAGELIGGAGLGAVVGELLKVILNLGERVINFHRVVKDIRSKLKAISPLVMQIDELNEYLEYPKEETQKLRDLMVEGKQLLLQCSGVDVKRRPAFIIHYHLKKPFYTKKLRELDSALRSFMDVLLLQMARDVKQMGRDLKENLKMTTKIMEIISRLDTATYEHLQVPDATNIEFFFRMGATHVSYSSFQEEEDDEYYDDEYYDNDDDDEYYDDEYYDNDDDDDSTVKSLSVEVEQDEDDVCWEGIAKVVKDFREIRYEWIFHQTFDMEPDEQLQNWFLCELSTTTTGVLFVSTTKLAYCSNHHFKLNHHAQTQSDHDHKVVIRVQQLKAVKACGEQQSIQVVSVEDQECLFSNFINYDAAVKCLQQLVPSNTARHAADPYNPLLHINYLD